MKNATCHLVTWRLLGMPADPSRPKQKIVRLSGQKLHSCILAFFYPPLVLIPSIILILHQSPRTFLTARSMLANAFTRTLTK